MTAGQPTPPLNPSTCPCWKPADFGYRQDHMRTRAAVSRRLARRALFPLRPRPGRRHLAPRRTGGQARTRRADQGSASRHRLQLLPPPDDSRAPRQVLAPPGGSPYRPESLAGPERGLPGRCHDHPGPGRDLRPDARYRAARDDLPRRYNRPGQRDQGNSHYLASAWEYAGARAATAGRHRQRKNAQPAIAVGVYDQTRSPFLTALAYALTYLPVSAGTCWAG